jgi:hypothetical protein
MKNNCENPVEEYIDRYANGTIKGHVKNYKHYDERMMLYIRITIKYLQHYMRHIKIIKFTHIIGK